MTSSNLILLGAFAIGYLLGSIPFGLLLTRAAGLGDVRKIGSGNIGATNVLRTGNKKVAALTLFLDGFKGYLAVVLAGLLLAPFAPGEILSGFPAGAIVQHFNVFGSHVLAAAGLGAFLGHIYPVWLGFRGGKGVATYIGVLFGLAWKFALAFCAIWLLVAAALRYSSLAALIAAALTPVLLWSFGAPQLAFLFLLMTLLLFYKHKANIVGLLGGSESKIGEKSVSQDTSGS